MNTGHPHLNSLWADLMVEELVRTGVDYFCLSPGSRSTPLTAAVVEHATAKKIMHFDERGAAFHALGYARATGRPAALICTSGTAIANYYPAVVEASMDHVPMIVLTTDRPPELRGTGANQTIDQVDLYGRYVRSFTDMPCPSESIPPETVLTTIDQAVYRAMNSPAGPSHINCMYREPLAPLGGPAPFGEYLESVESWRGGLEPYTQYRMPTRVVEPSNLEPVASAVGNAAQGLIVVGRLKKFAEADAVAKLARALKWPVIADVGSSLRNVAESGVIGYADHVVAERAFGQGHRPDVVLHIGPVLTSRRIWQWLAEGRPRHYIKITDYPERDDPEHIVTQRYQSCITTFCDFLLPFTREAADTKWRDAWLAVSEVVGSALDETLAEAPEVSEPGVVRAVSRGISPDTCLFVASSMPIRYMDMYTDPAGPRVPIGCNRGASGIDGTIASFAGFTAGEKKGGTLLIGDLAMLHDLNSLAMLRGEDLTRIIVVLNNDGGGIFHFLPIASREDIFEPYWGTPHGLGFESAARMFDLAYQAPTTMAEFEQVYKDAQEQKGATLIEICTDRAKSDSLHRALLKRARAVVGEISST